MQLQQSTLLHRLYLEVIVYEQMSSITNHHILLVCLDVEGEMAQKEEKNKNSSVLLSSTVTSFSHTPI